MTGPAANGPDTVLRVDGLKTVLTTGGATTPIVKDLSLELRRGEILGLVGESGSGKSMTGLSILGLVEPPVQVTAGTLSICDEQFNLVEMSKTRHIRGARIAMVFQNPMSTLSPTLSIGTQMADAVLAHQKVSKRDALDMCENALRTVGIPSPAKRLQSYPHEMSGGMRQRVAIAIALVNQPDVIIADEATTALDVTIQAQILSEVQTLCRDLGTAMIWITHDLSVVAGIADQVSVMYGGSIVEHADTDTILDHSRHPYTEGLIRCATNAGAGDELYQIPGMPPRVGEIKQGCAFAPRCFRANATCTEDDVPVRAESNSLVRCHFPTERSAETSGTKAHSDV